MFYRFFPFLLSHVKYPPSKGGYIFKYPSNFSNTQLGYSIHLIYPSCVLLGYLEILNIVKYPSWIFWLFWNLVDFSYSTFYEIFAKTETLEEGGVLNRSFFFSTLLLSSLLRLILMSSFSLYFISPFKYISSPQVK